MESLPKRPRPESDAADDHKTKKLSDGKVTGKPKPCMKYFSTTGCPFGESCHFLHHVHGGLGALGLAPVVSLSASSSASAPQKKTTDPGSVTVNGFKTKLCNNFSTSEGCRFGDRCHFAHGENDLRPSSNMPRGNNQRLIASGPRASAPPGFSSGSHFANSAVRPAPAVNGSSFPPQGYTQTPPQGYGWPPPQDYTQPPPQGYGRPPPQGYTHPPPQGYTQPPPQGYSQPNQSGVAGNNQQLPNSSGYSTAPWNPPGFSSQGYTQSSLPANAGVVDSSS